MSDVFLPSVTKDKNEVKYNPNKTYVERKKGPKLTLCFTF